MSHTPDQLEGTVERFCVYVLSLPESALAEQDWGPKEVLAHLVYHHELYVHLVETYLAGVPVEPPQGRFRDLNAAAVAATRGEPVLELVERFRRANRRLLELYRDNDPKLIPVEIKARSKLRTLAGLLPEVEAHIRGHLYQLRRVAPRSR
jgi:hypothetical protein